MKSLLFTIILFSFQFAYTQQKNDEELIRSARQSSNEAIAKQDVERITSFWLDDYVVIRGSGVIESGKETNKENWHRIFKEAPKTYFERFPNEIIVSKTNPGIAWETGVWKGFNTYSSGGRYSAQWKKIDGVWKMQAELFVAIDK
jgi:ketosteroid isomerase-like protein